MHYEATLEDNLEREMIGNTKAIQAADTEPHKSNSGNLNYDFTNRDEDVDIFFSDMYSMKSVFMINWFGYMRKK